MFLSILRLNSKDRMVRRDLADGHALHRTIMAGFETETSEEPRSALGILHRLEHHRDGPRLYVQSLISPDWAALEQSYLEPDWSGGDPGWKVTSLEALLGHLEVGRRLRFRLRANVTRKIGTSRKGAEQKSNGQRVPLRTDEERVEWLMRRLEAGGSRLSTTSGSGAVRLSPSPLATGRPRGRGLITLEGVDFDGVLVVEEVQALRAALRSGLGPAKAFGFGLLSLAPVS